MANIGEKLLGWFDEHQRTHLPWRTIADPYRVWVSEIMLQQTRVETVIPYFNRFMESLPDVRALAACPEDRLLKLWEGLGYYSRARNLQKAAKKIVEDDQGLIPGDYDRLVGLPGIGPYTAGAIASIAFQLPRIAADGNAYRIAARLTKEEGFLEDTATKRRLEDFLRDQLPVDRPGDFNQALMDLGSSVCIPKGTPLCSACPLRDDCSTGRVGTAENYPRRKEKKKRRIEEYTVFLFEREGRMLLVRRPSTGLLSGMWSLPMKLGIMKTEEVDRLLEAELKDYELTGLGSYKHIFSHVEWHMTGYRVEISSSAFASPSFLAEDAAGYMGGDWSRLLSVSEEEGDDFAWSHDREIISHYSIPSAYSYFLEEAVRED